MLMEVNKTVHKMLPGGEGDGRSCGGCEGGGGSRCGRV